MTYFRTHPSTQPVPLDPQLWAAIQAEPDRLYVLPLDEFRAVAEQRAEKTPKLNAPVQAVENRRVAGPDGEIPIRIFHPQGRGPLPVLVYFHGGGWVVGTLDTHDDVCRALCHRAGCVLVSVDYRRAPEFQVSGRPRRLLRRAGMDRKERRDDRRRFPAGRRGRRQRRRQFGGGRGDPRRDQERLRLALQVLIYPVTNYGFDTASYHENADGYGLSRDAMMFFWESYLAHAGQGSEPCASPLRAANLAGLPPALILTAQFDPLRDDGEAYAARLHRAGVPVRLTRYLDMNHGFLMCGAMFPSAACALQEIADWLKEAFRT